MSALPLAVQMAREVLAMHEENEWLRAEVAELKEFRQKYLDELQHGINHSGQLIGTVLGAILDPGSRFNRGEAAIKELGETS